MLKRIKNILVMKEHISNISVFNIKMKCNYLEEHPDRIQDTTLCPYAPDDCITGPDPKLCPYFPEYWQEQGELKRKELPLIAKVAFITGNVDFGGYPLDYVVSIQPIPLPIAVAILIIQSNTSVIIPLDDWDTIIKAIEGLRKEIR